jgi:hypothetical protein
MLRPGSWKIPGMDKLFSPMGKPKPYPRA